MSVLPHVVGGVLVEVGHHAEVVGRLPGGAHGVAEARQSGVGGVMGVSGQLAVLDSRPGAGGGGLPGGGGRLAGQQTGGVRHRGGGAHVGEDGLGGRGVERGRQEGLGLRVGGQVGAWRVGRAGGGGGPGVGRVVWLLHPRSVMNQVLVIHYNKGSKNIQIEINQSI